MKKENVVFYGLSTEGYSLASQMAINGADVQIIDESANHAILLKPEIAKTYTNVISLREDEPLLAMEPSNIAISKAKYLFFTPRIRKTGQDLKTEINSKFKDAAGSLEKGSSIINCLATGFGGNNENISLLRHVAGQAAESISYFYFPLNDLNKTPDVIGSLKKTDEKKILTLLKTDKKEKKHTHSGRESAKASTCSEESRVRNTSRCRVTRGAPATDVVKEHTSLMSRISISMRSPERK